MRRALALLRDSKGQDIVEFALILPFLLVLIGGIVDFGITYFAGHVSQNAARDGARLGATIPPPGPSADSGTFPACQTTGSAIIQEACSRIPNIGLFNGYTVSSSGVVGAAPNQGVTVTVTGSYRWFLLQIIGAPLPLVGGSKLPNPITISRAATLRWEWQPPPP